MSTPRYNNNLYNPYEIPNNDNKNQQSTESERLDRLEKEVCCLRNDFDRLKLEQAIAEAAIGRAILRGSASLGGYLSLPQGQSGLGQQNSMANCPMNPIDTSKSLRPQLASAKSYLANESTQSKKNRKDDGEYFTLG